MRLFSGVCFDVLSRYVCLSISNKFLYVSRLVLRALVRALVPMAKVRVLMCCWGVCSNGSGGSFAVLIISSVSIVAAA